LHCFCLGTSLSCAKCWFEPLRLLCNTINIIVL
jgi:hypothetical protein